MLARAEGESLDSARMVAKQEGISYLADTKGMML